MTELEKLLLVLLEDIKDNETRAVLIQSFIQDNGPVSDEAGVKIRALLGEGNANLA